MKHIILFLFPVMLCAQRDSLTNDYRVFGDIDTTTYAAGKMIVTLEMKNRLGTRFVEVDSIASSYFADYIDSLITLYQPDSIINTNVANTIYNQFRDQNTQRLNTKNRLVKLWAIKP
jgi:hypothetical protein